MGVRDLEGGILRRHWGISAIAVARRVDWGGAKSSFCVVSVVRKCGSVKVSERWTDVELELEVE